MDKLENELVEEQEKLKNITEEVESTFVELSGYWKSLSPRIWSLILYFEE